MHLGGTKIQRVLLAPVVKHQLLNFFHGFLNLIMAEFVFKEQKENTTLTEKQFWIVFLDQSYTENL